jgi:pyruvate dehydrogenase E1 component
LMNENYAQPSLSPDQHVDVLRGCYLLRGISSDGDASRIAAPRASVTLMGSGAILTEVMRAAIALAERNIDTIVLSVTSWSELARDGIACDARSARGETRDAVPFMTLQLARTRGPIIAATDYVRAVPDSVRAFVPPDRRYVTLGTDGFGRSDTRNTLREYFGVDAQTIVATALRALDADSSSASSPGIAS